MTPLFKKNPLFFSFLFPAVLDGVVTLLGQDRSYWEISYRFANEASPAYYILAKHPALFALGGAIWFIVLYLLFLKLKSPWNLMLAVAFVAGHAWGSSTWLWKFMRESNIYIIGNQNSITLAWTLIIFYFLLIGIIAGFFISKYIEGTEL